MTLIGSWNTLCWRPPRRRPTRTHRNPLPQCLGQIVLDTPPLADHDPASEGAKGQHTTNSLAATRSSNVPFKENSFPLGSSHFLSLSCCFLMLPVVSCLPFFSPFFLPLFFQFFVFHFSFSHFPLFFRFSHWSCHYSSIASIGKVLRDLQTHCDGSIPSIPTSVCRGNVLLPCLPIVDPAFLIGSPRSSGFLIRDQPHVAQHKLVL